MIQRLLLSLFVSLAFASPAWAIIEISGNFGYDKKTYGNERQNTHVRRSYSSNMAFYFTARTAIELNYYYGKETATEKTSLRVQGTSVNLVGLQNRIETNIFGIGIRQAFGGRDALVRPFISLGYAKQFVNDLTEYNFSSAINGQEVTLNSGESKRRVDSVFGTFTLQFRLTAGLSLNASVRTVFKAFEFNRAGDDLRYMAGFSWIF